MRPRLRSPRPAPRPAALLLALAAGLGLAPLPAAAQSREAPEQGAPRAEAPAPSGSPVTARHGMVVAANPHASRAGLAVLTAGGNAMDAIAATAFVLNVVEPQSSGLGGGGFLLYHDAAEDTVIAIDGREEAPAAATPDLFLRPDGTPEPFYPTRITGGRAVGVPGLLAALDKGLALYGRRSLADALAPATELAAGGFAVSPRLAGLLAGHAERLRQFRGTRRVFFDDRGEPLAAGDTLRQPWLAATFRRIAREGADAFYRGPIGQDVVRAVRSAPVRPGRMTAADLWGYEAPLRRPVRGAYRGRTIYGMGPPSSGGPTLIEMLHLLATRDAHALTWPSAALAHHFVQAARLAYADRGAWLADPDFVGVPLRGLLSRDYARRRAGALDWSAPLAPVAPGRPPGAPPAAGAAPAGGGRSTTHLVAVDRWGNVAALTASIEQAFGSGMVVPGRGFFLNNELTDFAARPTDKRGRPVANRVEGGKRPRRTALDEPTRPGGKRPLSSMAPTLVFRDGEPVLAIGSPGGPLIIQYVAWALLLMWDHGLDVQAAIEAPHIAHYRGTTLLEEGGWNPATVEALQALGHEVRETRLNSGLHAIRLHPERGTLHGGADPRREGTAEGY